MGNLPKTVQIMTEILQNAEFLSNNLVKSLICCENSEYYIK